MLRRTFKVSSRCLIIAQKLQKQKFFVSSEVRFSLRCKGKRARWTSWHRNKTFSQENSHNCKSFWMKKKLSKMVAKYKGGKEWEMRKSEKERKIRNFPLYVYIRTLPMILQRKTKAEQKFFPSHGSFMNEFLLLYMQLLPATEITLNIYITIYFVLSVSVIFL